MPIRLQAYTFVALQPVLARRTATYACAAQASVRPGYPAAGWVVHLEYESA